MLKVRTSTKSQEFFYIIFQSI